MLACRRKGSGEWRENRGFRSARVSRPSPNEVAERQGSGDSRRTKSGDSRRTSTRHSPLATFRWFGQGLLTRPSSATDGLPVPAVGESPGDPRRTKPIRNESSRDQRAVKTNFAACHPRPDPQREPGGGPEKGVNAGFAPPGSLGISRSTPHAPRLTGEAPGSPPPGSLSN